ncbi:MAG: DUF1573 domain-containing protein [Phycisphaerae bacterium]|nr:DUF1573 domain-containing protein [Phycisphaerae bacterium]
MYRRIIYFIVFVSLSNLNMVFANNRCENMANKSPDALLTPKLIADPNSINFGITQVNTLHEGKFQITNKTNQPIEISHIETGCGCTLVDKKLIGKIFQPGQSEEIKFKYKTKTNIGLITKYIIITSKPLTHTELLQTMPNTLKIPYITTVKHAVETSPKQLRFELRQSPENIVQLNIKSTDKEAFYIKGFSSRTSNNSSDKFFSLKYDIDKKDVSHNLTLIAEPNLLQDNTKGVISIDIDHPKIKNITFPYTVTQPFEIRPATKMIPGYIEGTQSKPFTLQVISNFKQQFELGEITSQYGRIEILDTTKIKEGYKIKARLNVPENYKSQKIADHITIKIKDIPTQTQTTYIWGKIRRN